MRVVALNSAPCGTCFYCSKHQENLCEDLLFNNGAYAEYIRIPRRIVESNMLAIPKHVSFEEAAMVEPLACVLRGLHETKMEIGDYGGRDRRRPHRTDVRAGSQADRLQRDLGREARLASSCRAPCRRRQYGADYGSRRSGESGAQADRMTGRGCDVVIEAVGRPQAWEWSIDMVRKGGTVNFFGGCANGTTVALDTQRLHYNELTLKATFHHTPETVRQGVLADLRAQDQRHRLHHRRSAIVATATGSAAHAEPQRRHQDGDHPGAVEAVAGRRLSVGGREFSVG